MTEESRTAIVLLAALCAYLIPTLVATVRQRPNVGAVAAMNILGGWTIIGWVLALVWALSREGQPPKAVTEQRRSTWSSPVEYVPLARREAAAALVDPKPPTRAKFKDAEDEARATHRAAQQPGGGAWS